MSIRKALAALAFIGLVGTIIGLHAPLLIFIDVHSFFVVAGVVVFGMLSVYSWEELGGLETVFFGSKPMDEATSKQAQSMFSRGADLAIGAAYLGATIGLIQMLTNLADPSKIGPAMAVALLSPLYGICISELACRSAITNAARRAAPRSDHQLSDISIPKRQVVATTLGLACIGWAISLHVPIWNFDDFYSMLITVGATMCLVIWAFEVGEIRRALRAHFTKGELSKEDAELGWTLFRHVGDSAIGVGLMGTLLGCVMMLQALDDPGAIGPALGVALLTSFYGLLISEALCRPIAARFLTRANPAEIDLQGRDSRRLFFAIGIIFIVLCTFFVMMNVFCEY